MSQSKSDYDGSAELIKSMLDISPSDGLQWIPRDLPGILSHQYVASLECLGDGATLTLSQLLDSDDIAADMLRTVKDWAKHQCHTRAAGHLPEPVAKVVYTCVLLKAVNLNVRLTRLSRGEVRNLAFWCLAQHWLPEDLAAKLHRELSRMQSNDPKQNG